MEHADGPKKVKAFPSPINPALSTDPQTKVLPVLKFHLESSNSSAALQDEHPGKVDDIGGIITESRCITTLQPSSQLYSFLQPVVWSNTICKPKNKTKK